MKKQDLFTLSSLLATPVLLILVGAVLAIAPDLLTFLISQFLGWVLLLIGVGFAVAALVSHSGLVGKILGAVAAFALGGWLTRHPLGLATQVGTFLGILLLLRGGRDAWLSNGRGRPLSIALMVVGVVLVLCPLSATRIVFSLCGVAMVIVGIVMVVDKLRSRRYLDDGGKPDIIDAL